MERLFHLICGPGSADRRRQFARIPFWFMILTVSAVAVHSQTAQTGALTGIVTDPTGRVVQGVTVKVTSTSTGQARTAATQNNGKYVVPLLPPDVYKVEVSQKDFKTAIFERVRVNVTETAALNVQLQIGSFKEIMTIEAQPEQLNLTDAALGHVTDQRVVENMPLVTRNYTQILGLSPGVSGEVNNSASIGRGNTSMAAATEGYSVGGNATNDNNFQMNGTEVNDLAGEANISGGIPVPNPDAIQEFKVQVGQYDASYGRNAGANVDVVTKSGTNAFHGDVWEYFRNTALNANDYFLNRNGQPRGVLNQNQFGGTFGGPIVKDKAMFFISYQGTRERDGLDQDAGCLTSGLIPPQFTNDPASRTADALAANFNGEPGLLGGQINSASDISPTALAVLNAQLPGGSFVVPGPQNNSSQTNIVLSSPCKYRDDQVIGNLDLYHTEKSHFSGKFFGMNSDQIAAFPNNQLGFLNMISVPGFPQEFINKFRTVSLTHTYAFSGNLLNQAIIGFHRLHGQLGQNYPGANFANSAGCGAGGSLTLTSLCVPEVPGFDNPFPDIVVIGDCIVRAGKCPANFDMGGNGQGLDITQNFYDLSDSITYVHGKHSLHFGGGVNQSQINFEKFHFFGGLLYPSVPDFLLGNVFLSIDVPGVFDRAWRTWDGNAFIQDNYQILPHLSLNLGFRYERQGQLGEYHGRASTFDPARANPNPPDAGTLQGFIVASNFSGGAIPADVIKAGTNTAINNDGQNGFEPRIGFAWQLPGNHSVLRGGYGLFVTRTTSEPFIQLLGAPPWGTIRQVLVPDPTQPFQPSPPFPIFTPYSPTTDLTPTVFSVHFRPPILQRYSMTLQTEFAKDWMFELGYQGSRGTKLIQGRSFNQALPASPSNPVHGQTDINLSNVLQRAPILGFDPAFSTFIESAGASWYNALGASVSKRFSHGLQLLASYTWASALETSPFYTTGSFTGGSRLGDQNSARANYGFDDFIRPQRFVLSYVYELPWFKSGSALKTRALGGWSVAGVATFQNGQKLTIVDTNQLNAFGIASTQGDRVQLAPGCTNNTLVTRGSVTTKLNNYFNSSCFTLPPIIGDDGLATAFGNSGNGIVSGPDQRNFDISAIKKIPFTESKSLEFRAEFFNVFNTPSFANPSVNAGTVTLDPNTGAPALEVDPSFGHITRTSIAPRIIQFALKLYF